MLEKTLASPLDCKEIQPVHPKGDQSWVFIGRTDAEAETPILWPPDVKSWLSLKHPDAGKDWGQEEKGMTEDEMVGWHHQLSIHEFKQIPGVGDGQGGLACCDLWGHKESDTTERLNWTEMFDRILLWSHLVLGFCFLRDFDHNFNFSACNWVVHNFYFFWFSLRRLNFSKNLSISSRVSILLPYSCS